MGSARPSIDPGPARPLGSVGAFETASPRKKKESLLQPPVVPCIHPPTPSDLTPPRHRRQEAAGGDTGGWRRSAPRLGRGRCRPSPCAHPRRQEAAGREPPRHPRLEVRRTPLRHRPGEAPPLTPPRHRRQEAAGRAPTQHPPRAGPAGRYSSGGAPAVFRPFFWKQS